MHSGTIAAVGDNTIDRYLDGRDYVGGNALNVAVQLSMLGEHAAYFGAVGDDEDGRTITALLRRCDLDLAGLVIADGPTALTEIRLTTDGDRIFEREDFGVTADYHPSTEAISVIAATDWVHIGMLPRASELVRAIRTARPTLPISQDCAVAAGYADLDVAFCSAGEDEDAASALVRNALEGGARLAVVTRGAAGALASDGSAEWRCAAVPVDVVDTTGAGDSFMAGFLQARLNGDDVRTCLEAGARAAARTCLHIAGFPQ